MDKKPVLITLDYPPELGGVARYLGELVRASKGRLDVIVPAGCGFAGPGNVTAVECFRTLWPRWWPLIRVCRGLRKKTPCLLVSHVLPVGTAAMISRWTGGPPYAVLLHGLDIKLATRSALKRLLFELVIRNAKHVFVNSEATAAELRKHVPRSGVTVVTPGIKLFPLLSKSDARVRLGIQPDEHVILSVGRLIERKGFEGVLRAAAQLPSHERIRIVQIGNGSELQRLREEAKNLPHRVQFIERASDEHKYEWYAAADVFCLPVRESNKDMEGFGIVFLEAALAGLPVIAGKAGGVCEAVVDRETGLLVQGDDVREIARALTLLLGDSERARAMGQAGKARAERDFKWEDRWEMFKKVLDV